MRKQYKANADKADVAFADGHAQPVSADFSFTSDKRNSAAGF